MTTYSFISIVDVLMVIYTTTTLNIVHVQASSSPLWSGNIVDVVPEAKRDV